MANSPPHPNTAADSPLDDPPLPTATPECDVGATYPPGLARGKQDGRAPPHDLLLGDDASKIEEEKEEEERGLLRDGAELDHRDERSRPGGGLDILRGRDWRQLWRENRRVILIRIFCIVVIVFALAGLICGTIANRAEHGANPVAPALLVHPLVP